MQIQEVKWDKDKSPHGYQSQVFEKQNGPTYIELPSVRNSEKATIYNVWLKLLNKGVIVYGSEHNDVCHNYWR